MRTFTFDREQINSSHTLQVTSHPSRVCFCDLDTPACEHSNLNTIVREKAVYPGDVLKVSVTLAGYNFGRVAGSVYTNVVDNDYRHVINPSQHVQTVNLTCSVLNYKLYSRRSQTSHVMLVLTAQDHFTFGLSDFKKSLYDINSTACTKAYPGEPPCTAFLTTPVYINITLKACPLGFMLRENECKCDETIDKIKQDHKLNCDRIGYITRRGSVWVGVDSQQYRDHYLSNTETYYWYTNCPRDYCNASEVSVNLTEPDKQCELYREGLLCGRCQNGSSLLLGSNKCEPDCDNKTLALLIAFAALGILLVALISTLDLNGTVNSLIFYANIFWINKDILLSPSDMPRYFTIPIAWINLDFGIEICFSEKLDQLTKTGLQFVFPVYIWCIAGLIIIICHYSTRATKLFGKNSVTMLATLFLLSYGKLFRSIRDVFIPARITDTEDCQRIVWALDGNIEYNDPLHIVLVVIAVTFLLLFLLPFTILILLVPFLKTKSEYRLLSWINRFTPFFDTFYGPYKHKKRYQVWTGVLLVFRVVILFSLSVTSSTDPYTNILVIITICVVLFFYAFIVGHMYKKLYVSLLEVSYLLNLIILGGVVFLFHQRVSPMDNASFNDDNMTESEKASIISLSVVIFQFGGIVVYHFIRRIMSFKRIRVCVKKEAIQEEVRLEERGPTTQVVEFEAADKTYDSSRFRDSILA